MARATAKQPFQPSPSTSSLLVFGLRKRGRENEEGKGLVNCARPSGLRKKSRAPRRNAPSSFPFSQSPPLPHSTLSPRGGAASDLTGKGESVKCGRVVRLQRRGHRKESRREEEGDGGREEGKQKEGRLQKESDHRLRQEESQPRGLEDSLKQRGHTSVPAAVVQVGSADQLLAVMGKGAVLPVDTAPTAGDVQAHLCL